MRFLHAQPIFSGKKGTMTRHVRKPYTHLPPPYRFRHFFDTEISFSYHRAFSGLFRSNHKNSHFWQKAQKLALFSAFSPSHLFQQKLFQCIKNLFSGLQKFFCGKKHKNSHFFGKKNNGNTRAARTLLAARRGQPAHVVGAYTLNIQEEEHGLHKTAGCGAERCRRKLRGGMPAAEPWEFF